MLKSERLQKTKHTIEYLDCSVEEFKEHIERCMEESNKTRPESLKMNWSNIHLDHIKPVSRFNLQDPEEFSKCCHWSNIQPLLAQENLEKNNKWTEEDEKEWLEKRQ